MIVFISSPSASSEDADVRPMTDAILEELVRRGHNVLLQPDTSQQAEDFRSAILRQLQLADVVLIVVNRPSVGAGYELALAEAAELPVVVAAPESTTVGAFLSAVPLVRLSGDIDMDAVTVADRVERVGEEDRRRRQVALPTVSEDLVRSLTADDVPPAAFERGLADWLARLGAEIELPGRADSSYDLILHTGDEYILVEAKRYRTQERVSAESVYKLAGAVATAGATAGLLVTNSGFTAAASALAATTPVLLVTVRELLETKSVRALLDRREHSSMPN